LIFRTAITSDKNYTLILNKTLRHALSPQALGLLCYLLSHNDDWVVYSAQLQKHFGCGKLKIQRIANELEQAGFVVRRQLRAEKGRFGSYEWLVFADRDLPQATFPRADDPPADNQPLRSNNSKNNQIKENIIFSWENIAVSPPDQINRKAWQRWCLHKQSQRSNKLPSKAWITKTKNDFLKLRGFDIEAVIEWAIKKNYQGVPKPDWKPLANFKDKQSRLLQVMP